jgi:hypothetical protein
LASSVVSAGNRWKRWGFRGKGANAMPKRQSHLGNTGGFSLSRGQHYGKYTEAAPFFPVRNGLSYKTVAFDLETLQVLGKLHLETQNFQDQVRLLQQGLP